METINREEAAKRNEEMLAQRAIDRAAEEEQRGATVKSMNKELALFQETFDANKAKIAAWIAESKASTATEELKKDLTSKANVAR